MAYEDNILIKLRRDYSENEVVMYTLNKIKELQTENGQNKSYIQELEDEIKEFKISYKSLPNQLKTLKENYRALKEECEILKVNKNKIISLSNRLEKQYLHGRKEEQKSSFLGKYIRNNLSENKLRDFYRAQSEFEEMNNSSDVKAVAIKI